MQAKFNPQVKRLPPCNEGRAPVIPWLYTVGHEAANEVFPESIAKGSSAKSLEH